MAREHAAQLGTAAPHAACAGTTLILGAAAVPVAGVVHAQHAILAAHQPTMWAGHVVILVRNEGLSPSGTCADG